MGGRSRRDGHKGSREGLRAQSGERGPVAAASEARPPVDGGQMDDRRGGQSGDEWIIAIVGQIALCPRAWNGPCASGSGGGRRRRRRGGGEKRRQREGNSLDFDLPPCPAPSRPCRRLPSNRHPARGSSGPECATSGTETNHEMKSDAIVGHQRKGVSLLVRTPDERPCVRIVTSCCGVKGRGERQQQWASPSAARAGNEGGSATAVAPWPASLAAAGSAARRFPSRPQSHRL